MERLRGLSTEGDPGYDDEARGSPGGRQAAGPAVLQRRCWLEVRDPWLSGSR